MNGNFTFDEPVASGVTTTFHATRVLHETRTANHHKVFFDNAKFGRVLMLDGAVQVTSADEFVYHEMMSHVPLCAHPAPEHVLIIGGGDCGLAEEVLKHREVKRVTQVEIDPEIVRLSRAYFPAMNATVFSDPRFELIFGDGAEFVAKASLTFDVILVDSTDPRSESRPLFGTPFYRDALRTLNPGGVLVAQLGLPFLDLAHFAASIRALGAVFPETSCYLATLPSVMGGPMAFGWARKTPAPPGASGETLRERATSLQTIYYTPEVHEAAFVLPRYLQETLVETLRQK